MHIEPGFVAPAKVMMANVGAIGVLTWAAKEHIKTLIREPWAPLKVAAAAVFFTLFMQSFHMPVGPSELHFVGAMAMYLTLGFIPTLLGFAIGLGLQGLVFEPADLVHLGVNSLSLIVPLVGVHYAAGRKLFDQNLKRRLSLGRIIGLDALYYGGVTAMVGFWLAIGEVATPLSAWLTFASSYLALVVVEPIVTYGAVRLLKRHEDTGLVSRLFAVRGLSLAR
ncbi:MAG: energy-coupling factor ABC transporter permease [Rhodobacterales bacterium]|nr:energy-coupling factor ABC transporter permease [Rhodobacterales bacterium]